LDPKDFGCYHSSLDAIVVDSPSQSLGLIESVLQGKSGPARDMVLLNSAAALYCAGITQSYETALEKAAYALDSGQALRCFDHLKSFR
jgi:anthranilate phosphoribosyltransferase